MNILVAVIGDEMYLEVGVNGVVRKYTKMNKMKSMKM